MSHFLFFYLLLAFLIGGGSIILTVSLILIKNSFNKERFKLYFLSSFTAVVVFQLIVEYLRNTNLYTQTFFPIMLALSDLSVFSLIYFLPLYIHDLISFPFKRIANMAFLFLFLIISLARILPLPDILKSYTTNLGGILFFTAIVYSSLIMLLYPEGIGDQKRNRTLSLGAGSTIGFLFILFLLNIYEKNSSYIGTLFSLNSLAIATYYLIISAGFLYLGIQELKINQEHLDQDYIPVLKNNFSITEREVEIIYQLIMGKSYKEISESLFISVDTVKTHTQNIYKKLNVNNKVALTNKINELISKRIVDA